MDTRLEALRAQWRDAIEKHTQNGVLFMDPATTFISPTAEIGKGTVVYPNNHIEGDTKIGENCELGPNNRITGAVLCDDVTVQYSVVLESTIGKGTRIGPFAYIRPGTVVGEGARIGDFVELKNSTVGDGSKVPHLTYVGDTDIGKRTNIGCGTVTVNYDGKNKFRTTIGDDVFIGCNTNLIAPVTVHQGAYTAAGSTITEDVSEKNLAIARARQTNKENWLRPYEK